MPRFRYEVKKGPGGASTGVIEADTQRAAVARLRDMGYFPISIEEDAGTRRGVRERFSLARIRLKERNLFFRQLANLIESGMPILRALNTLAEQSTNPKLTALIANLREDIQKGGTFADALEKHPRVFSAIHCNLVRAGEEGGMLEEVLWRLVAFGEQEEELRGKAFSAMVYPAFLIVLGTAAIFILVSFVFPKFLLIFEDFNQELPWPTRVVMTLCAFMGQFWWAVLIGGVSAAAALLSYLRTSAGRMRWDRLVLRMPAVGVVVQKYEMSRFARTLGTLLDNGVPVVSALRITADTLGNRAIAVEIAKVEGRVTEGEGISAGLRQCQHFTPIVVNMVAVGEESGRLGAVIKRVADAYDIEVDRAVKTLTSLMEPILIVVMGVIIGFLVIAMLLPMLTLSANVA